MVTTFARPTEPRSANLPVARRPRLLMLAPQPFFESRGTPIAVRHIIEVLSRLDVEVDLVTFPVGTPVSLPGLRIHRVGKALGLRRIPIGLSMKKVVLDVLLAVAALRLLRARSYDWIHAVEESAFAAAVARRFFGVRVLYDMASSLPVELGRSRCFSGPATQRLLRACESWLLRNVDQIVCSAGIGERVARTPSAAPVEEWVFPGLSARVSEREAAKLRARLLIPENAPIVVYTGTFAAYQGLDLLLAAGARLHDLAPGAVLVLVGADEGVFAGVEPRPWLRLVPRQPRERIGSFLAIGDVAVSPRLGGGNTPLKVFDYMASGKAIVATDCAAHRVLLDESRARLVPADPDAMAEAIAELLRSPELADRLSRAARAYAGACLTKEAFERVLTKVYGLSIGGAARPGTPDGTGPVVAGIVSHE